MVYLKSVENVITLGKLIGLLFLFCLPLLSILFLKTKRNDLARPVMGTIFLVNLNLPCLPVYGKVGIPHSSVSFDHSEVFRPSYAHTLSRGRKDGIVSNIHVYPYTSRPHEL